MKKFRRIAIFVTVACLALGLMLFAGCNNEVTLTLDAGNGGTLSADSLKVKSGAKLSDVLKNVTVTADSGLTFAGWFNGEQQITDSDVMPKEGLTLTAKYDADYTVNVYYNDVLGKYPDAPSQVIGGKARFGAAFSVDTSALLGEADDKQPNRLSTDSLGKSEVFDVYRTCEYVRINFNANLAGVSTVFRDVIKGSKEVLPDGSVFQTEDDLRLAGWARSADTAILYEAGDEFDTSSMTGANITLYAKWERGISDVFGGSDYLFVSTVHSGTVYLHRRGLEEKTGSYNAATGTFSFAEGNDVRLEGKITEDGFYYFGDLRGQTIANGFDPAETISFNGGDSVTLVYAPQGGDRQTVQGSLEMDKLTGEYVFVSDKITFKFSVNTVTDGDGNRNLVFNRPQSDKAGFYYNAASNSVLYLDDMTDANGIGGMIVFAVNEQGELSSALRAFYYVWGDMVIQDDGGVEDFYLFETTYAVITANSDYPLFLFRIKENSVENKYGVDIRGEYTVSDEVFGHYFENAAISAVPDLLLDGFGTVKIADENGDYAEGTYTIKTNELLMVRDDGSTYTWTEMWLETSVDGKVGYQALYAYDSMPQHYAFEVAPSLTKWANSLSKSYNVQPSGATGAYLYESAIYGAFVFAEITTSDGQSYYYEIDNGVVTANDDGTFRFTSEVYTDQNSYWDFRRNGEVIETSFGGAADITFEGGEMSFDKWGTLTYQGKTYPYGSWTVTNMPATNYVDGEDAFRLEIYTLTGAERATVKLIARLDEHVTDDQVVYTRRLIATDSVTDLVWKQFYGQSDYFDKLYLVDETHAAIAVRYDDGLYHFVIYGTYIYDERTQEYTFVADAELVDDFVGEIGDSNLVESYSDFRFVFQTDSNGNKSALKYIYEQEYEAHSGAKFQIDGYGNAKYTPADGQPIEGTYQSIDYYGKYLLEFVSADKSQTHLISIIYDDNDEFDDFIVDAEGAGQYYLIYSDGSIYLDTYLVLLGDYSSDRLGTAVAPGEVGTYEPTGVTVNYYEQAMLSEYKVVLRGIDSEGKPYEDTMYVALGTVTFSDSQDNREDYNCFVIRADPQADRHFDVVGGGTIEGDGYNDSTYIDKDGNEYYGLIGIGYIDDSTPIMSNYHWHDDFDNGKNVIFRATYAIIDGRPYEGAIPFLFDLLDNGKLSLRDDYNATYALYDKGSITQKTLYLDGHGNAEMRDENGNVTDTGTYSYIYSLDCLMYTSDKGDSFRFNTAQMSFVDETWLVYFVIGDEKIYVSDDWTVLLLGAIRDDETFGYINGLYIDERGIVHGGFYSELTDNIVRFEFSDGTYRHYEIIDDGFALITDECIVRDGVLLAYQGPTVVGDFAVPDGVKAIGGNAFAGVYKFGGSMNKLDLNEVERIEDYAFYGIHEFGFTSVSSDKVTYVGNYAFYVAYNLYGAVSEDKPTYWIFNVNLPNAEYIGDYAFNANNQMNNGVTKLNKVKYIGYSAFSHNYMDGGDNRMVLDLTDADISAIQMDKNAFLPGPNGTQGEGLPVTIWVRDAEAMAQAQEAWDSAIYDRVVIKEASIAGVSFVDFVSRNVLLFGQLSDESGKASYFVYDSENGYAKSADCNYVYAEYGSVRLTFNGTDYEFEDDVTELRLGEALFLRAGAEHTFDVTEENGSVVKFRFTFGIDVTEEMGEPSVSMSVLRAIYDGHATTSARVDIKDFICALSYVVGEETINTEVDMTKWTSESVAWGLTVYTDNGDYRALLEQPLGDGYYYLTLEILSGNDYVPVEGVTDIRRSDVNVWTCTLVNGDQSTEYIITFDPDTELITVVKNVTRTVQLTTEDEAFRATFACDEQGNAVKLHKLEELNAQYGYYDAVYNFRDPSFGMTVVQTAANTFTVTTSSINGRTEWIVTYVNADTPSLTVTKDAWTTVTVESDHVDDSATGVHDNYFKVVLFVDGDGNVQGIAEITPYIWNNGNNFYDNEVAFTPSDVTVDNNVLTFTHNDQTYRVTVVKTADDKGNAVYTVAVTVE